MARWNREATLEALDQRAQAAIERARERVAAETSGTEEDHLHAPLSWWRARWTDRGIKRLFIESFDVPAL